MRVLLDFFNALATSFLACRGLPDLFEDTTPSVIEFKTFQFIPEEKVVKVISYTYPDRAEVVADFYMDFSASEDVLDVVIFYHEDLNFRGGFVSKRINEAEIVCRFYGVDYNSSQDDLFCKQNGVYQMLGQDFLFIPEDSNASAYLYSYNHAPINKGRQLGIQQPLAVDNEHSTLIFKHKNHDCRELKFDEEWVYEQCKSRPITVESNGKSAWISMAYIKRVSPCNLHDGVLVKDTYVRFVFSEDLKTEKNNIIIIVLASTAGILLLILILAAGLFLGKIRKDKKSERLRTAPTKTTFVEENSTNQTEMNSTNQTESYNKSTGQNSSSNTSRKKEKESKVSRSGRNNTKSSNTQNTPKKMINQELPPNKPVNSKNVKDASKKSMAKKKKAGSKSRSTTLKPLKKNKKASNSSKHDSVPTALPTSNDYITPRKEQLSKEYQEMEAPTKESARMSTKMMSKNDGKADEFVSMSLPKHRKKKESAKMDAMPSTSAKTKPKNFE
ncbi:unnamed protein product [Bursaphelenchus xylophilus]|uniref:(pine wood nematode) hypothetical protein n=1 Tax=Bursaphelenchus xylophilus TaxID=6326 RepID=A0A1I7SDW5_BURXY|nr:unnamed protein product [Bursaphelenchus xylophilus]CAG9100326.1 unnamed protein product [Bursaphelenchus xylophilus]